MRVTKSRTAPSPEPESEKVDWTIVLSGPIGQRASVLGAVANYGANLSDLPKIGGNHNFPHTDSSVGWVTVRHHDLNGIVERARLYEWNLRAHWQTPTCQECNGVESDNCQVCRGTGKANNIVNR